LQFDLEPRRMSGGAPIEAFVDGIGIIGPGFANWPQAREVLAGREAYQPARTVVPTPSLLPAAERRRTDRVVKLAIAAGLEAAQAGGAELASLQTVFTSSGADGSNCHEICSALAGESRELSPTRFHNSVHNAAAGYWSIATGAMAPANVLCAFDASFGAGLLDALAAVAQLERPVLLIAYDTDYPEPIRSKRPIPDAFGVALLLTPQPGVASLARLLVSLSRSPFDVLDGPMEFLRAAIPAARSLPILRSLAQAARGRTVIEYLDAYNLLIEVTPCD
jgi:Beta-ketoacyl synthase, N-terminal domain